MNYNSLMNKPTINYRELIGDNSVTEVGGITEEQFNTLLNTDLSSYYTKAQIDDLFARSFVYREKSGSIVTFDCPASVNGIDKVVSEIVAVQSGTGDPSPTNIRPFTGWSAVNVVVSPTTDVEDGTTYTTTLKDSQGNPLTCYGGTLDVVSGVLTVDRGYVDLGTLNWSYTSSSERSLFTSNDITDYKHTGSNDIAVNAISECFVIFPMSATFKNGQMGMDGVEERNRIIICDNRYTDATAFKTAMSGVMLVYELATPQTIPQDNLAIASSAGINNIWSDSGDITVKALDRIIQG